MKFFGNVLTTPALEGLLQGIKLGFNGLRILEFSIDLTSSASVTAAIPTDTATTNAQQTQSKVDGGRRLIHGRAAGHSSNQQNLNTYITSPAPVLSPGTATAAVAVPVRTPADLAEAIIGVAKDRAYVGKNGLSVTVNYR